MTISITFKNPGKPIEIVNCVSFVGYNGNAPETLSLGLESGEERRYPAFEVATLVAK